MVLPFSTSIWVHTTQGHIQRCYCLCSYHGETTSRVEQNVHCAGMSVLAIILLVMCMFWLCCRSLKQKLTLCCTVNMCTSRTPSPISVLLAISALPIHLTCHSTTASTLVSNHFSARFVNENLPNKFIYNSTWGKEPHLWKLLHCVPENETFMFLSVNLIQNVVTVLVSFSVNIFIFAWYSYLIYIVDKMFVLLRKLTFQQWSRPKRIAM